MDAFWDTHHATPSHDSDYYLNAKKIGKEGDNLALEVKIVPGTNIGRTILGNNFISYILVFYPIRFEM